MSLLYHLSIIPCSPLSLHHWMGEETIFEEVFLLPQAFQGRLSELTSQLGSDTREGCLTKVTEDAVNQLQRQMCENERSIEDHLFTLHATHTLLLRMEEYNLWCGDIQELVLKVTGSISQSCSVQALSALSSQFNFCVCSTVIGQEHSIRQMTDIAVKLHGLSEGKRMMERMVGKHSDIMDSIRGLQQKILSKSQRLQVKGQEEMIRVEKRRERSENEGEMTEEKRKGGVEQTDNRHAEDMSDWVQLKESGHTPELTREHDGKEVPINWQKAGNMKPLLEGGIGGEDVEWKTPDLRCSKEQESSSSSTSLYSSPQTFSLSCSPLEPQRRFLAILSQSQPSSDLKAPTPPHVIGPCVPDIQWEFGMGQEMPAGSDGFNMTTREQDVMSEESLSNDDYECVSPDEISLPPLSGTPESNLVLSDGDDATCCSSHSTHYNQYSSQHNHQDNNQYHMETDVGAGLVFDTKSSTGNTALQCRTSSMPYKHSSTLKMKQTPAADQSQDAVSSSGCSQHPLPSESRIQHNLEPRQVLCDQYGTRPDINLSQDHPVHSTTFPQSIYLQSTTRQSTICPQSTNLQSTTLQSIALQRRVGVRHDTQCSHDTQEFHECPVTAFQSSVSTVRQQNISSSRLPQQALDEPSSWADAHSQFPLHAPEPSQLQSPDQDPDNYRPLTVRETICLIPLRESHDTQVRHNTQGSIDSQYSPDTEGSHGPQYSYDAHDNTVYPVIQCSNDNQDSDDTKSSYDTEGSFNLLDSLETKVCHKMQDSQVCHKTQDRYYTQGSQVCNDTQDGYDPQYSPETLDSIDNQYSHETLGSHDTQDGYKTPVCIDTQYSHDSQGHLETQNGRSICRSSRSTASEVSWPTEGLQPCSIVSHCHDDTQVFHNTQASQDSLDNQDSYDTQYNHDTPVCHEAQECHESPVTLFQSSVSAVSQQMISSSSLPQQALDKPSSFWADPLSQHPFQAPESLHLQTLDQESNVCQSPSVCEAIRLIPWKSESRPTQYRFDTQDNIGTEDRIISRSLMSITTEVSWATECIQPCNVLSHLHDETQGDCDTQRILETQDGRSMCRSSRFPASEVSWRTEGLQPCSVVSHCHDDTQVYHDTQGSQDCFDNQDSHETQGSHDTKDSYDSPVCHDTQYSDNTHGICDTQESIDTQESFGSHDSHGTLECQESPVTMNSSVSAVSQKINTSSSLPQQAVDEPSFWEDALSQFPLRTPEPLHLPTPDQDPDVYCAQSVRQIICLIPLSQSHETQVCHHTQGNLDTQNSPDTQGIHAFQYSYDGHDPSVYPQCSNDTQDYHATPACNGAQGSLETQDWRSVCRSSRSTSSEVSWPTGGLQPCSIVSHSHYDTQVFHDIQGSQDGLDNQDSHGTQGSDDTQDSYDSPVSHDTQYSDNTHGSCDTQESFDSHDSHDTHGSHDTQECHASPVTIYQSTVSAFSQKMNSSSSLCQQTIDKPSSWRDALSQFPLHAPEPPHLPTADHNPDDYCPLTVQEAICLFQLSKSHETQIHDTQGKLDTLNSPDRYDACDTPVYSVTQCSNNTQDSDETQGSFDIRDSHETQGSLATQYSHYAQESYDTQVCYDSQDSNDTQYSHATLDCHPTPVCHDTQYSHDSRSTAYKVSWPNESLQPCSIVSHYHDDTQVFDDIWGSQDSIDNQDSLETQGSHDTHDDNQYSDNTHGSFDTQQSFDSHDICDTQECHESPVTFFQSSTSAGNQQIISSSSLLQEALDEPSSWADALSQLPLQAAETLHLPNPDQDPDVCRPLSVREAICLIPVIKGPPLSHPQLPQGDRSKAGLPGVSRPLSKAGLMENSELTLELEVSDLPKTTLTWLTEGQVLSSEDNNSSGLEQVQASDQHVTLHSAAALQDTHLNSSIEKWLVGEVYDIISLDWNTWFGTLCVLLWLLYLVLI